MTINMMLQIWVIGLGIGIIGIPLFAFPRKLGRRLRRVSVLPVALAGAFVGGVVTVVVGEVTPISEAIATWSMILFALGAVATVRFMVWLQYHRSRSLHRFLDGDLGVARNEENHDG